MAEIIILTSVCLIFLLILIQNISIRLLYKSEFSAEIDYSFFCISLTGAKGQKNLVKINPKLFLPIKRAVEFLLSHSELKISEIKLGTKEDDPRKFGVRYRNAFSLFSAITVYLSKKAKKLSLTDNSIVIINNYEKNEKYVFDISISTPLCVALVFSTMFLVIFMKNKKLTKIKAKRG